MKYGFWLKLILFLLLSSAAMLALALLLGALKPQDLIPTSSTPDLSPSSPKYTTVIIDAGHGGEDGGAISCTGMAESGYNLQIALRLQDLFHLLGYETKMIRTTDTAVYTTGQTLSQKKISDLKERVRIVNDTENALLLSIHQNTFPQSRYSGAQVFYNANSESEELAKKMQSALVRGLDPGSKRQSKQSKGIYLMEHIRCVGVLVECGFLSNPTEEAKLRDPDHQKKLCCVIAAETAAFLKEKQTLDRGEQA